MLAGLCLLDLVLFSDITTLDPSGPGRAGLLVAFAAVGFAVLPLRHRAPLVTFGLMWFHGVVTPLALQHYYDPTVGLLLALYGVAARRPARVALLALAAMVVPVGVAVYGAAHLYAPEWAAAVVTGLGVSALIGCAWGCARWAWTKSERLRLLELVQTAEREAVAAERRRVARELHDIVSHSVTAMVLQAAGAARIANTDPARAAESLHHIECTGIEAMAELRRMLGLLKSEGDPEGGPECFGPQPSLGDLDVLLRSLATAGVAVEVQRHGEPAPLDPSVDLTAYRIIQESFTNVLKHCCAGVRPQLELRWDPHVLLIRIHDDGGGRPAGAGPALSNGNGIAGLKARSEAVGGRLSAGPRADGGYEVVATLPIARPGS